MDLSKLIEKFKGKNVLVVGDVMLDEYIKGDTSRISPEAPVPVLKVQSKEYRLGGAANVAYNITSLGANCTLIGQVGNDDIRNELVRELKEKCIDYFFVENNIPTIKKTRIIAQNQQVIRVDSEEIQKISENQVKKILSFVKGRSFDVIIVADYNKGVAVPSLIKELKKLNIKIVADPKPNNIELFKNVYAVSPNLKEAQEITKETEFIKTGKKLEKMLNSIILLTRGPDGLSIFQKGTHQYIPSQAKEVYDVSGAGDTFTAVFALATVASLSAYDSAIIANHAAGLVVSKFGTASLTRSEFKQTIKEEISKVKSVKEMKSLIKKLKAEKKKIVFTNGCFDILHVGHVKLLNKAKSFGDVLILGLNTDKAIKKLKGPSRPINNQEERAEVLANLNAVDFVVFFGEDTPVKIISELKPNIHIKGGDYNPEDFKQMPEAKIVKEYGGIIKIVELFNGKSTSGMIEKIKK